MMTHRLPGKNPTTTPLLLLVQLSFLKNGKKLGEGTYAEVFLIIEDGENMAMKIIQIKGALIVNGEQQKSYEEWHHEIVVTKLRK